MYPIPSHQKLQLHEIAYHWAIELRHPDSDQLLERLERAWWGGEFGPIEAARRIAALKELYKHNQDVISFAVPGREDPEAKRELPDGGVEIFRFYRVPLPNEDPGSWTGDNCAEAFVVFAETWNLRLLPDMSETISFVKLTQPVFMNWVRDRGYDPPNFWVERKRTGPSAKGKTLAPSERRPKKSPVFGRVLLEMQTHLADGTTTPQKLRLEKELALTEKYQCSRTIVRKARDEALKNKEL